MALITNIEVVEAPFSEGDFVHKVTLQGQPNQAMIDATLTGAAWDAALQAQLVDMAAVKVVNDATIAASRPTPPIIPQAILDKVGTEI